MARQSVKRRTPRRAGKRRSFITTTYHEPKWMVKARRFGKVFKRQTLNLLALIGLIALMVYLAQWAMRGG